MSLSLSKLPENPLQGKDEIQIVLFTMAACEMCVEINQVREIIRVSEITLVPKAPKFLEGVINLRGRVVPVVDLRRRFDMPIIDLTPESRILVVEMKEQTLGLLADKVVEVLRVPQSSLESPRSPYLNIGPEFIEKELALGPRLILKLNLAGLLSLEEAKITPGPESPNQREGNPLAH